MKVLTFSSLYPNAVQPRHGIFVEQRLRQLLAHDDVDARVLAPVPWFPSSHRRFGRYAAWAQVPALDQRHGIDIVYPRYPVVPKVGANLAPWLMASFVRSAMKRIRQSGFDFDLIDAHYLFPDGVAAAMLAARYARPVVLTARGTDVNVIAKQAIAGRMVRWAAARASAVVTVSQALAGVLERTGVDGGKISVLRNGVDTMLFRPMERSAARKRTCIGPGTLLSVGNLLELKGHHLAISALHRLPGVSLVIIGDGPLRGSLENLVQRERLGDRVRFVGTVNQSELADYYNAADALVLASAREGMPNVVLECMACGTPVVATSVGGVREILAVPVAGRIMVERSADALADCVEDIGANPVSRDAVRRHAEQFDWASTAAGIRALFEQIAGSGTVSEAGRQIPA